MYLVGYLIFGATFGSGRHQVTRSTQWRQRVPCKDGMRSQGSTTAQLGNMRKLSLYIPSLLYVPLSGGLFGGEKRISSWVEGGVGTTGQAKKIVGRRN